MPAGQNRLKTRRIHSVHEVSYRLLFQFDIAAYPPAGCPVHLATFSRCSLARSFLGTPDSLLAKAG